MPSSASRRSAFAGLDHSVFLSTEPYQLSGTFKLEIDARNKEI
jgi:hypothetical protein